MTSGEDPYENTNASTYLKMLIMHASFFCEVNMAFLLHINSKIKILNSMSVKGNSCSSFSHVHCSP